MSTLIWVLAIYLVSVAISYPLIRMDFEKDEEHILFSNEFLAKRAAWMPCYNLYLAFKAFLGWITYKLIEKKIRSIAKKHKGTETGDNLNHVADMIKESNKI